MEVYRVSRSQCVTGNARSHGRLLAVIGAAIEGAGRDRNYCLWWTDVSVCTPSSARFSLSLAPSTSSPVIYWSPQEPYITVGLKAVHSLWTFCLKDQQQLAIQHPALCNETIRFRLVSCAHLHSLAWRTKRSRAGLLIRAICVTPFTVVKSEGREPVSDWPPAVDMSHQWKTALWLVPACGERCSQICINFLPERQVRQIN